MLFCLKKSKKNALHQWRKPGPSQGSFLWLSDLFASGYIISVFDISVKHKFNTFCYQNFSTLIVKAYFCSSSCLLFFSRRYERAVLFSLLLYYMLLKRRTDKPKIKTFQIALQLTRELHNTWEHHYPTYTSRSGNQKVSICVLSPPKYQYVTGHFCCLWSSFVSGLCWNIDEQISKE